MYGVVIVEDEELERQALRSILTDTIEDIHILGEARSGPEAVELIDRCDIDLMLVDINIPKMNGLDVIRYLRERHTDTKVIITTAYDYFEITRTAIQLKADEYLLKPIRPQVLVSTVQTCLQQLGASRRCCEIVSRLRGLLEQDAYRDGVALVRQHVEWIYSQQNYASRELVLYFAQALVDIAGGKALRMTQQAARLRTLELGEVGATLGVFLTMVDLLFDVTVERFEHSPDTVQRALNYIERNLNKGVTLEDVAEQVNVSASYLSRLFKKSLNINFITYLTSRRIEIAKELLSGTERPVTNIAQELSYNDVNYFCKSFKKEVGSSPSEYRRQSRLGQGGIARQ